MEPRPKLRQTFRAGFLATLIMTCLMYVAPLMGMSKMDIAAMLGSFVTQSEAVPTNAAWSLGIVDPFRAGNVSAPGDLCSDIPCPLAYQGHSQRGEFRIDALVSGASSGMGAGTFSTLTPRPVLSIIGSLIGHLLDGAVLGQMIGKPFRRRTIDPELEVSKI